MSHAGERVKGSNLELIVEEKGHKRNPAPDLAYIYTCIAALLNGLHNSGIGPIITAARKEIASGKRAKKNVRNISKSYVRNEEVKVVNY